MAEAPAVRKCACGTDLAPALLCCPVCDRLVHADELARLAAEADTREAAGDLRGALAALRSALALLPSAARQHAVLHQRLVGLSDRIDHGEGSGTPAPTQDDPPVESAATSATLWKTGSALGAVGLLLWKFKFIAVFLATKAKLLVLGLSKSTTLFSMLLSLGVYWTAWGWRFALGLVLSIYVHEMGHVAALRRFGIQATAPMFLPGLGAVVRLHQYPQTAREDARVGLAGPMWGLGAALLVYGAFLVTDEPLLAAIASVGAWINLFNLIPFWQLDGARGFRGLSRVERWVAVATLAGVFYVSREGLLLLLGIGAVVNAFSSTAPAAGDRRGLLEYCFLVVALSALALVPVAIPG